MNEEKTFLQIFDDEFGFEEMYNKNSEFPILFMDLVLSGKIKKWILENTVPKKTIEEEYVKKCDVQGIINGESFLDKNRNRIMLVDELQQLLNPSTLNPKSE